MNSSARRRTRRRGRWPAGTRVRAYAAAVRRGIYTRSRRTVRAERTPHSPVGAAVCRSRFYAAARESAYTPSTRAASIFRSAEESSFDGPQTRHKSGDSARYRRDITTKKEKTANQNHTARGIPPTERRESFRRDERARDHEAPDRRRDRGRRGGGGRRRPADGRHAGVHPAGRQRGHPRGEPVQRRAGDRRVG